MIHVKQLTDCDCGAISYMMIVNHFGHNIDCVDAIKEVKCDKDGTSIENVSAALILRKINHEPVNLDVDFNDFFNTLNNLSQNNIIYVSGVYKNRFFKRGRDKTNFHAVVIYKGMIFDPSEDTKLPIDAYFHTFNKSLNIKKILLIGID